MSGQLFGRSEWFARLRDPNRAGRVEGEMTSAQLDILESAFTAEINAALNPGTPGLIQTKGKLAKQLAADGFLSLETVTLGGRMPVRVTGYALTHKGRMAYCDSDRVRVGINRVTANPKRSDPNAETTQRSETRP